MVKYEKNLALGILSCFGGLFIHLIVGAYFQWGFINVYITSYYRIKQPGLTLESNGIVFPLMQLCIAPTMKLGVMLSKKIGSFPTLLIVEILIAVVVFASSYLPTFLSFVFVFGIGIGSLGGLTFLIPLIQCNKYIQGKRMHVNGVILTGTGLGSLIFGQFVYNYLNPEQLPSNLGYYDQDLQYIAQQVPECLRYLSILYLTIGVAGAFMMLPVIRKNKQIQQALTQQHHGLQDPIVCPSMCQSLKTKVFYAKSYIIIFAVCGNLLLNGNFKTYVQKQITDDSYLTLIGTIGSLGNALCRFLWNMCFNQIGYRKTLAILCCLNAIILATIRYTVQIQQLYCFMIFVANSCLGGFLVLNITHSHLVFGIEVGSNLDLFYWSFFSFSNFIGYGYVSGLSSIIGFNNIFYICLAMNVSVYPLLIFFHFQSKWSFAQKGIKNQESRDVIIAHKKYNKKIQAYANNQQAESDPEVSSRWPVQDQLRDRDSVIESEENEQNNSHLDASEASLSKIKPPKTLPPLLKGNKVMNLDTNLDGFEQPDNKKQEEQQMSYKIKSEVKKQ